MPYIPQYQRDYLSVELDALIQRIGELPETSHKGVLNYVVCELIKTIFEGDYSRRSDGIAALNDAAQELYRRWLAPYEDQAAQRNGDIFGAAGQPVDSSLQLELPLPLPEKCRASRQPVWQRTHEDE